MCPSLPLIPLAVQTAMIVAGPIKIAIVDVRGDKIRLGFDAPAAVQINRQEIAGD